MRFSDVLSTQRPIQGVPTANSNKLLGLSRRSNFVVFGSDSSGCFPDTIPGDGDRGPRRGVVAAAAQRRRRLSTNRPPVPNPDTTEEEACQ
jgi:hypothetical protein